MSIYLNTRAAIGHFDRDNVEPAWAVVEPVPGEIVYGHLRDAPLLPRGHRFGRSPKLLTHARFHLDEHGDAIDRGDDVDFAEFGAVAAITNCVPEALELGAREIFPHFSQQLAAIV